MKLKIDNIGTVSKTPIASYGASQWTVKLHMHNDSCLSSKRRSALRVVVWQMEVADIFQSFDVLETTLRQYEKNSLCQLL